MIDTPETAPRQARRALTAVQGEAWAILPEALETILAVAERASAATPEALEAYRAQHVPTAERLQRRGPVAIIEAVGPMFRRANILTALSGATSYDIMRRDLQTALDDRAVKAIVLNLDTPGGTVNGVDELAKAIHAARSVKPIVAYIGGIGASAGYWLASQATEIVVSDAAIVGSIGVRAVVQDTTREDAERGRVEFVSSQSPGKRTDLATDEGRARVQRTVDALAAVFIDAVAKGRNVSADTVAKRFGAGDVLVGVAAVKAGMADRLGSFEDVVAELGKARPAIASAPTATASEQSTLDRARAILELPEVAGRELAARHLAFNTDLTVEDARAMLQTMGTASPKPAPTLPRWDNGHSAQGLVLVHPPSAHPPREDGSRKAEWGNVLAKLNGRLS